MQIDGNRLVMASPSRVWAALVDPAVLQPCIPGCESMTGSATTGYEAVLAQKAGPLSFRVTGVVTLSDVVPGQGALVSAAAKGGASGVAAGTAQVRLTPEGQGTLVSYAVEARLHGAVAQLGGWIIEAFAKRMADQFFTRFEAALGIPVADDARAPGWLGRVFGKPPGNGTG